MASVPRVEPVNLGLFRAGHMERVVQKATNESPFAGPDDELAVLLAGQRHKLEVLYEVLIKERCGHAGRHPKRLWKPRHDGVGLGQRVCAGRPVIFSRKDALKERMRSSMMLVVLK
ncbi:MAG TPA: hypothetical protein PK640_16220, partial [Verrucomicrobiota bacterium]|nr:hypothetical protein [Verrucomicrobiota bacterium]